MANDCMNTLWFCSMDKNLLQQLFDKFRSCFDTTCEGKVADSRFAEKAWLQWC